MKPEITDELVSFDEVIILELRWMVDLMAEDDLFCILVMDFWYFLNNQQENPSNPFFHAEVIGILLFEIYP